MLIFGLTLLPTNPSCGIVNNDGTVDTWCLSAVTDFNANSIEDYDKVFGGIVVIGARNAKKI